MQLIKKLHISIWRIANKLGPFAPLVAMLLLGLLILSASRLGLVLWKFDRVTSTGKLLEVLVQGIRVDIIQLSLIVLIPLLLAPVLAIKRLFKFWQKFTYIWVVLAIVLLVFLEAATPGFIGEYDIRPNRIFVEYLKYPNEVFGMLWRGFKVDIFAGLGFTLLAYLGDAALYAAVDKHNSYLVEQKNMDCVATHISSHRFCNSLHHWTSPCKPSAICHYAR